jgi:mRNA m6A methyltransferase non-catalytic subunit
VHCNVGMYKFHRYNPPSSNRWLTDTDVLFWEGDPADPTRKPPEMRQLIENFCLGTRRLEIFARAQDLAPGWVGALSTGEVARLGGRSSSTDDAMGEDGGATDTSAGELRVEVDDDGHETLVRVGARRWERSAWEEEITRFANGGKAVVPMSTGAFTYSVFFVTWNPSLIGMAFRN